MIMYEIASGLRPFYDTIQDFHPIFIICGRRPDPPSTTPSCYIELMNLCWDPDPRKRPTASYLVKTFDDWIRNKRSSFQDADLERKLKKTNYYWEDNEECSSQAISLI
jgi:hypothetical protein